jgi:cytoskeletal protein CcmA (bactofilin family)
MSDTGPEFHQQEAMTDSHRPPNPEDPRSRPASPVLPAQRPALPSRLATYGLPQDSSGALFVGKGVRLSGEVGNCRRLVIQGELSASQVKAAHLEVREGGRLKGRAEAGRVDLEGSFEGDLRVEGLLAIGPRGRAQGSLRYGDIEITRGGRLAGDLEELRGALPMLRYERQRITVIENKDFEEAAGGEHPEAEGPTRNRTDLAPVES